MHIFVINLERSVERRTRILARLAALGLQGEIFPALEGENLDSAARGYAGRRRRLFFGKDMTDGEIGCTRSHLAVCAEIVRRNIDHALVLEDDALLDDRFPQAIEALMSRTTEWDLVRFLAKPKDLRRARVVARLAHGFSLCRAYGVPGGAYVYLLNRKAAERLVRQGRFLWVPIDILHGQIWGNGLKVRCISPCPARPDMETPSTIGDVRFSKVRALQGWERALYPLTRLSYKLFDALTKHITYWGGVAADMVRARLSGSREG